MGKILIPILTILTRQSEEFFKLTFVFFFFFFFWHWLIFAAN